MSENEDKSPGEPEEQGAEQNASEKRGNPIKEMFVLAALYLPLGFFLWFFFGSALMFPSGQLVDALLTGLFPGLFDDVVQLDFIFEIQTLVIMEQPVEGQTAALNLQINPMIYAWGMALLFGLIMATPLTARQRPVQLLIGFFVVSLVTVWGVFWEAWADLAFRMGPEAAAAARESGLPMNLIALFYQMGYLMFPAVIPVAAWILMNRPFIEQHVLRHRR